MKMKTDDYTYKLLNQAADILVSHGWCQGAYQDEHGRYCMMGAIKAATHSLRHVAIRDEYEYRCNRALELYLRDLYDDISCISVFNDRIALNADMAIDALRNAAAKLEE